MKKYITLIALFPLLFACGGNNEKKEAGETKITTGDGGQISFKVDGQQVNSEGWNVMRFIWDSNTPGEWLNITSNMHKDKRTINVNLNGAVPGKYVFMEGSSKTTSNGVYFPDFSKPMMSYLFESGEFNITGVDTDKNILNGTFSGTAVSIDGQKVEITDGKLVNVKIKPGVVNLDEETKKAMKELE
jgi:hypothetical protein